MIHFGHPRHSTADRRGREKEVGIYIIDRLIIVRCPGRKVPKYLSEALRRRGVREINAASVGVTRDVTSGIARTMPIKCETSRGETLETRRMERLVERDGVPEENVATRRSVSRRESRDLLRRQRPRHAK